MIGLAHVDGFKIYIQVCVCLGFPPLNMRLKNLFVVFGKNLVTWSLFSLIINQTEIHKPGLLYKYWVFSSSFFCRSKIL